MEKLYCCGELTYGAHGKLQGAHKKYNIGKDARCLIIPLHDKDIANITKGLTEPVFCSLTYDL